MTRTSYACEGAHSHRPAYLEVDRHHIYPMFLADLLGVPERKERVFLCSGCHDIVHHLIKHLINEGDIGDHHTSPRLHELARTAHGWWLHNLGE